MINQIKEVKFNDSLSLNDAMRQNRPAVEEHRNFADIFDSEGNHIMRTFNAVVNTGRLFTLIKVFNLYGSNVKGLNSVPTLQGDDRWVSVWAAGKGGIPDPMNPEETAEVAVTETELADQLKFNASNDSFKSVDNLEFTTRYWNATQFKDFEDFLIFDDSADTGVLYFEVALNIDFSEFQGENVNELGLFICKHDKDFEGKDTKEEFEMFSRITFPSLPNATQDPNTLLKGDSYTIIYRVYA